VRGGTEGSSQVKFVTKVNHLTIALFAIAVLVPSTSKIKAQTSSATLVGTVADSSGATVQGATTTVTNAATNVTNTAVTSATDDYIIPLLAPGQYIVSVKAASFKTTVVSGVKLNVDQTARVDFLLELGAVAEKITIATQALLANTDSSELGQVLEQRVAIAHRFPHRSVRAALPHTAPA
jgi:hypothetical protein